MVKKTKKFPFAELIETIWNNAGISSETVAAELKIYCEKMALFPFMDAKRTGNISEKTWAWLQELLDLMPENLLGFLAENRAEKLPEPSVWKIPLNERIDAERQATARFVWTQGLMPLLTPVAEAGEIALLRFDQPLVKGSETPKVINDEINHVLQDEDRFYQRQAYINSYGSRFYAFHAAERHYASLNAPMLMALSHRRLISPRQLLEALLTDTESRLCIKHLYAGDYSSRHMDGVSYQICHYLVEPFKEDFIAVLPKINPVETGKILYQIPDFTTMIETDDTLFNPFLESLNEHFFEIENKRMDLSNRIPPNRWLAYAQKACSFGFILAPYVQSREKNNLFPGAFVNWCREMLKEKLSEKDRFTLFRFLAYFESSETVMDFYRQLDKFNVFKESYGDYHLDYFIKNISEVAHLEEIMFGDNAGARQKAFQKYQQVKETTPWTELYPLAEKRPEAFIEGGFGYYLPQHDPLLIRKIWENSEGREKQKELQDMVLRSLLNKRYRWDKKLTEAQLAELRAVGKMVFDALPEQTQAFLTEDNYTDLSTIEWYDMYDHPLLNSLLLKVLAASSEFKESLKSARDSYEEDEAVEEEDDSPSGWEAKARELVKRNPDDLLLLTPLQMQKVLTFYDPRKELDQLSEYVRKQAEKTTSKEFHLFLADWLAPVPLEKLDEHGWLDKKFKRFETVSVEILLRKADDASLKRLETAFKRLKSQTLKDRILDLFDEKGRDTAAIDEFGSLSLEDLDQVAAKKIPKKPKALIKKIWKEEMAEDFAPLTESMMKWLFKLCEETRDEAMPRTGRQLLSLLNREQQAALTNHLFECWFDNKGNAAHEWATLFIRDYGDDRLVPLFLKSVKHWNKKSKPKTQKVIGWMGLLGTTYALSEVRNIYEGRFSESIVSRAHEVLKQVAEERGLSLSELFEELTPTLDYTRKGLPLEAGPRTYHARILPDGALIIAHENGKTTKSFPKMKKDEDEALYKASKSKLSFFKKNLRPIVKQQKINFSRYLNQGKEWDGDRWRKLFLDHPLLGALGGSLIWKGELKEGDSVAFRLSEDYSLITVDDETVDPDQVEKVMLWHPLEADDDEISAWREHLDDYELTPFIEQADAPCHLLEPDEAAETKLTRYQGHVTVQGSFRGILKKHGFFQEGTEDGGRFYGHYYPVGGSSLTIQLHHTSMTAWMEPEEPAAIDHVTFYDRSKQKERVLAEVSPRLISWMVSVLAEISAKGEGYSSGWQSLW